MRDVDELVTWLRAQLDEDERVARAAGEAEAGGPVWREGSTWFRDMLDPVPSQRRAHPNYIPMITEEDVRHIARHDPARVLREVEAKRRLIGKIGDYEAKIDGEWGCCHSAADILAGRCPETKVHEITALTLLALPYADRPGYQEEWRP